MTSEMEAALGRWVLGCWVQVPITFLVGLGARTGSPFFSGHGVQEETFLQFKTKLAALGTVLTLLLCALGHSQFLSLNLRVPAKKMDPETSWSP